jgi:predicted amino acid-binding ACT domain protein
MVPVNLHPQLMSFTMNVSKISNPRAFAKLPHEVKAFINGLDLEVTLQLQKAFSK